jgi:hypothetical protein
LLDNLPHGVVGSLLAQAMQVKVYVIRGDEPILAITYSSWKRSRTATAQDSPFAAA